MGLLVTDDVCTFILMLMCLVRKFWTVTCLSTVDLTTTRPKSRQRGPAGDHDITDCETLGTSYMQYIITVMYVPISQISGLIH